MEKTEPGKENFGILRGQTERAPIFLSGDERQLGLAGIECGSGRTSGLARRQHALGGWPTFMFFVKVGTGKVSCRLQKAPVGLYSSLLAGLPPTVDTSRPLQRTQGAGHPAIHFNDGAFHLDTAGVGWGYGLGVFLHGVDVGLGNINPGVPIVW